MNKNVNIVNRMKKIIKYYLNILYVYVIKTKCYDIITKVNGIKTKVNGIKTKWNGIKTKVNGIKTKVNETITKVNDTITKVNGIKTKVNGIKTMLKDTIHTVTGIIYKATDMISKGNGFIIQPFLKDGNYEAEALIPLLAKCRGSETSRNLKLQFHDLLARLKENTKEIQEVAEKKKESSGPCFFTSRQDATDLRDSVCILFKRHLFKTRADEF